MYLCACVCLRACAHVLIIMVNNVDVNDKYNNHNDAIINNFSNYIIK